MAGSDVCVKSLIAERDRLLLEIDAIECGLAHFFYPEDVQSNGESAHDENGTVADNLANEAEAHWIVPNFCVPINSDVRCFDFAKLGTFVQFDAIMMDPPWQLATSFATRGVHISYQHLTDAEITSIPFHCIQSAGFLFIWTINNKYVKTIEMMQQWGYDFVDEIVWVKSTVNRRLAKGHGYYLQHAKETCLVGKKGDLGAKLCKNVSCDVIFAERRGQSQKPEEIYELIEQLIPNGRYCEIFGRRNNLRNHWVTIGNEL